MRYVIASAIVMLLSSTPILRADETVSIGGSNAVLLRPSAPRASVILMPGGDGYIAAGPGGTIGKLNGNQLVRTRNAYLARGLAVLVVDADVNLSRAVDYMAAIKRPVTVVATSKGTLRAAHGIAGGAKPDALVLTSGFLTDGSGGRQNVANILGSRTHVVVGEKRHRADLARSVTGCAVLVEDRCDVFRERRRLRARRRGPQHTDDAAKSDGR